jgi:DNA-binding NtrC family response regulator
LLASGTDIQHDAIMLTGELKATPTAPAALIEKTVASTAVTPSGNLEEDLANLVGRTVADVERDLIINTLDHCLGNRTHAANILGISIRTLRNKLHQYTEEGVAVPPAREGVA